ncbi:hypothetical protein ACFL3M_01565 [Patescibacteria group bacterium]
MSSKALKKALIIMSTVFLLVACWTIYSFIRFDGFFNPAELVGLSDSYGFYKKNIEKVLVENGEEYIVSDVDVSGWKIYEDKGLGFRFSYPSDFNLEKVSVSSSQYALNLAKDDLSVKNCRIDINYPVSRGMFYDYGKNSLPGARRSLLYNIENNRSEYLQYIIAKNGDVFSLNDSRLLSDGASEDISFLSVSFIGEMGRIIKFSNYQNSCLETEIRGMLATFEFLE